VNKDAISELLRNLPRNKQHLISQGNTTYTMNDQVRNKIVHQLVAHQSISETSSESWMESAVSGGVPFTISEHVYFQEGGYDFKEGAFFNYYLKKKLMMNLLNYLNRFKYLNNYPILQNILIKELITKPISVSTIVV